MKTPKKDPGPPTPAGSDPADAVLSELGAGLRAARLRQNVTLEAVAAQVGVGRRVVAEIERGSASTSIGAWVGVLRALGFGTELEALAKGLGRQSWPTDRRRARGRALYDDPY